MAKPSKLHRVLFAQEQNAERLLAVPNAIGVASGNRIRAGKVTDEVCVQVFVERKVEVGRLNDWEQIPSTVAGVDEEQVRTDVIEITLPDAQQDRTRYRPVPGGCSIGPEVSVSAGTLGGWACDNSDDTTVLLSNNHVISNLDTMPRARRIVQPGRFDGGVLPDDVIGSLKRHIPLSTVVNEPGATPPVTEVDAAIGTITVDRTDNVIDVGSAIYELQEPAIGMDVQKRGRTTRLTTNGQVMSLNVTVPVTYANRTRLGRIANSFLIRSTDGNVFSAAGDSGSLIFNQQQGRLNGTLPVVGLLYAGGTLGDGTPITIACDINAVFGALNLTTICNCAVRAIIRAVFETEAVGVESTQRLVARKERQLRRLRSEMRTSRFGRAADDFVATEAAVLAGAVLEDPEAFGVAVRALEPWLRKRTVLDMLETELDPETVVHFDRLIKVLGAKAKRLRPQLEALRSLIRDNEGAELGKVLRRAKLPG